MFRTARLCAAHFERTETMAVREVLEIGHPLLAKPADAVDPAAISSSEFQGRVDDMIDTMRACNGAGIAANQIGINARMFVVEVSADNPRYPFKPPIDLTVLINPVISPISEHTFENYEGCLSVPGLRGVVARHLEVDVSGLDRVGAQVKFAVRGYSAGTFQHEFDHLDGVLFVHRVVDPATFCSWNSFKTYKEEAFSREVRALVDQYGA
jgi:peptide deformylase